MNHSPWIEDLPNRQPYSTTTTQADVVVVGGGISGICTAYSVLSTTALSVMVMDSNRIASGATGHNAGHVVAEFERTHKSILAEFGEIKTFNTYHMLANAWSLLKIMCARHTKLVVTKSYSGYIQSSVVLEDLEYLYSLRQRNISCKSVFLFPNHEYLSWIPERYRRFCKVVSNRTFDSLIHNSNIRYTAILKKKRGLMNSALFTENIAAFLLKKYSNRFFISEHDSVQKVSVGEDVATIYANSGEKRASYVVLCTNGYTLPELECDTDKTLQVANPNTITPVAGYMVGYEYGKRRASQPIIGIHNLKLNIDDTNLRTHSLDFSFLYLSERFRHSHALLVAGGLESASSTKDSTEVLALHANRAYAALDHIVKSTMDYQFLPPAPTYGWYGLMGYTQNMVRIVGKEPLCTRLIYNIGCNGNGILPAVASGDRIAGILRGRELEPTVFDVGQ